MSGLAYTITVAATAYPRAYAVGRKHKAQQRVFVVFAALTWALVATLVALKPMAAVFIFVLPMICSMLYTAWVTHDHHAGLSTQDQFHASYNNLNVWFNRITGNLGYHTAHHYRQGVHWSKLPQLHTTIAHHIPAHLYSKSTFDAVLPDNPEMTSRRA
jgi:fatty acid desaturase